MRKFLGGFEPPCLSPCYRPEMEKVPFLVLMLMLPRFTRIYMLIFMLMIMLMSKCEPALRRRSKTDYCTSSSVLVLTSLGKTKLMKQGN